MFNLPNLSSKNRLLAGASFATLLIAAPAAHATTLGGMTGRTSAQINATINPATNRPGGPLSPGAAAQQTSQSTADFSTALARIQGQLSAQASARSVAAAGPNNLGADPNHPGQQLPDVPNGLGAGGLAPSANVSVDPSLWQNADAPTQATSGANTTVTIHQNAQKAILTWDSFNVGKNTTVHFDQTGGAQSDGTNNWIALNRIVDPSDRPSQILGNITAEGSVYLINKNGIIFGGSSQVNVHSLIASSLSFLGENINGLTPGSTAYDNAVAASNSTFLNIGIAAPESTGAGGTTGNVVLGAGSQVDLTFAGPYQSPGDIVLQAGASVTTHENGSQGDGGLILLAGTNVNNAGTITANGGQAILAGGVGVSLWPGNTADGQGTNILYPEITGQLITGTGTSAIKDITPVSNVTNTGLVQATRGYIDLLAVNVNQNGAVAVTTGVSYPGGITITAGDEVLASATARFPNVMPEFGRSGQVQFSQGSITADLPEEDSETATSSPTSTFTPGNVSILGGSVTFQNGSLLEAPGAKVTVAALVNGGFGTSVPPLGDNAVPGRIYVDNGAIIDVAGLDNVELPVSDTLVTIPLITQNEIADEPNQSALLGLTNVVIDSTRAGTTADGLAWIGTPILNATGYAQQIPRSVDQLLTNAGTITLSGAQVLTVTGSTLNLDGGYVHYLGGELTTTRLLDQNGLSTDIGNANPNDVYVGVAGVNTLNHNRWGITDEYTNSLIAGGYFQPDYIQGGNAGTLTVFGQDVVVLDGTMTALAVPGLKQVAAGVAPSGVAAGGGFLPIGGTFDLGGQADLAYSANANPPSGEFGSIIIQQSAPQLSSYNSSFTANTPFDNTALNALDPSDPDNLLLWKTVPAGTLDAGGFANVDIVEDKIQGHGLTVAEGTTLSVQPGGSITYNAGLGGPVTVLGNLIAPSGSITLTSGSGVNITVGSNAAISTAGEWINDSDLLNAPGANTFINGGSITLSTGDSVTGGSSILLEPGSVLDVSSGGVMLAGGMLLNNGIPEGKGGSISLLTYAPTAVQFGDIASGGAALPNAQPTGGRIEMGGTIESAGFSGGGQLTIDALGFQIGGDPSQAPAWDLTLPADFFAKQGFGSYQLNAVFDTVIAPGTNVRLTQQNLIANLSALQLAPSGSDLNLDGLTSLGTLDPYHRQATNLTLTAGSFVGWQLVQGQTRPQWDAGAIVGEVSLGEGASINADAGSAITFGSPTQVTVLGSITAPGGSITLTADTQGYFTPGIINFAFTTPSKSVWLGTDAVLDVSGTTLVNPYAPQVLVEGNLQTPVTGKVLDGGSVILSDDTGYVVAQAGSTIDVSGTSAVFDMPQANPSGSLTGQVYGPQTIWSNAGSIMLGAANGLFFDGTLKAQAGAPEAEGGALTLLPEVEGNGNTSQTFTTRTVNPVTAKALILQQSGDLMPAGLAPGQSITNPDAGSIIFSADRLNGSGIATLILGGPSPKTGFYFSGEGPVPIAFAGNVNLSLANAVILNTSQIVALAAGSTSISVLSAGTTTVGGTSISINAPYIEITGPSFGTNGAPVLNTIGADADGILNITASFVDLENQVAVANFGETNITSSGDIRLSSTVSSGASPSSGILYTPGDLTLKAADIYPASGEAFVLDAKGPNPTTITLLANGASDVPLSAGGSLLIDADTIVQSGTIRAPFGSIVLGVGDSTDTTTQTQFDNLPLTTTQSVTLTSGSLTSVSADNTVLPYGTTTDSTEWNYNSVPNLSAADLAAPPAKSVSLNGASVSLNQGGTIDLSGGGTLQAEEWVPGTGGSRDVLSRYNVSYTSNSTGAEIPLYADTRNVYAIIPGNSAPVAAYDPVFAQQNPITAGAQSTSLGVGQAGTGDAVGKAVYLSGVPGLPAGVYTLLPAKYATLPGAFRVVQNTAASNVVPGQSSTLADGTHVVTGYFEDALSGSRSATPSQFEVQSAATWGKYSQYTLTSADTFFAAQAASAGTPAPALPMDAGQLVLAATNSLSLGATLNTAPAKGGAPAEVDIASQDIQIVGSGETALAGYLQLSANDLDALNAGSLLIGGTRSRNNTGVTILADANSVVVSNDAQNPLTGPEIILVTKTDTTGTDPNAVNGLRLDPGSVITATGTLPASADLPITIGSATVSGDGSLLRVSNGAQVGITRTNVPTTPLGSLTVAAGASVNGGAALLLDSSGALNFDPAATFSGTEIAVDAPSITITGNTDNAGLSGFVVGPNSLAQFANSKQVDLRSYSNLAFNGNLNLTFGENVDFSAGAFISDGGTVTISAPTVAFTNDLDAPSNNTPIPGQGSLVVDATEIDLGSGSKSLKGFGAIAMTASGGIVGQGTGSFDMGSANVTMAAPIYAADTGSGTSLTTTGSLALNSNSGTALTITPVGGAISFTAGSITDNGATIEAPAGNIALEAASGDLSVASGSLVSSAGVSKLFYDTTEYAPAGAITLIADQGNVNIASGSTLDFSGANGGGAAGSLSISAPVQTVALNGTIKGNAATGYLGGSFSLNTGGAVDLDNLATELAASGVNTLISVQSGAGNMVLSQGNTLTAQTVSLVADGGTGGQDANDGNVQILGTIDASGAAGGTIGLYGKSSVDLEGSLLASATNSSQRGGTVIIDTTGNPGTTVAVDGTYGYEKIAASNSGTITIGANALIDVTGGTAGDNLGGTVSFRAPLLDSNDVNIFLPASFNPGKGIVGSRATNLEAYAVWNTTDPSTGAQHFDGIIDPAGWYDANGNLLSGTFTNQAGTVLLNYTAGSMTADQLAPYLTNDFFTPTNATIDHETFYGYANGDATAAVPGTLMGFVHNFPIATATAARFANLANFQITPGVELDNSDVGINDGNISILTNWNLGAGLPNNTGSVIPPFRYLGGAAPIISIRAVGNVIADASITDGFFQNQAATILGGQAPSGGGATVTFAQAQTAFDGAMTTDSTPITVDFWTGAISPLAALDPNASLMAPLSGQASQYYADYVSYVTEWEADYTAWSVPGARPLNGHVIPITAAPATTPTEVNFASYSDYLAAYVAFVNTLTIVNAGTFGTPPAITAPTDPGDYAAYISAYNTYLVKVSGTYKVLPSGSPPGNSKNFIFDPVAPLSIPFAGNNIGDLPGNVPGNVPTANNPLPIDFAMLSSGPSSSYRIVAGANIGSADPLALQSVSAAVAANAGNVTLDGHTAYVDTNGQTLYDPTVIRTGTGSIDIAAAADLILSDTVAPGAIYSAGQPAAGSPVGPNSVIAPGSSVFGAYDLLVTPMVNPDGGGDITIRAQRNIVGVENTSGQASGPNGPGLGSAQFWWQWMEITTDPTVTRAPNSTTLIDQPINQTSIDFGAFDQGVMSVGGNVSISAGGDVINFAASLPTTWYNTPSNVIGGGNLSLTAGGNILSGDYFVAKGTGTITAGGKIGADLTAPSQFGGGASVSTLLAAQDGILNVTARQGVDIGGMFNPSYIQGTTLITGYSMHSDGQNYSPDSALNVTSTTGDVVLNSLSDLPLLGIEGQTPEGDANLPATVALTAFAGGISVQRGGTLYPSATGELALIADQSIDLYGPGNGELSMSDASNSLAGSDSTALADHMSTPLHAGDTQPVKIYSLTGDIIDGLLEPEGATNAGFYDQTLRIALPKPAQIYAAQNIVNLDFFGQNITEDDVTRIVAGRDIVDTDLVPFGGVVQASANGLAQAFLTLNLGGPGTFDVEAGRNISLQNPNELTAVNIFGNTNDPAIAPSGIIAAGNTGNPYLPHESANIEVLFGVGPGVANAAFVSAYVDPAVASVDVQQSLVSFMEQYDEGKGIDTGLLKDKPNVTLTADQAWAQFQALPSYDQQIFNQKALFTVLTDVDVEYNDPTSPFFHQYARGYQAINTLFPAAMGYTANSLEGGKQGANTLVSTGNLDIRSNTIQTQQGGNVTILGPGGQALIGAAAAPPSYLNDNGIPVSGPANMGILTLETGDVDIFTDQSLLLAQSRIFTEQGGGMTIWSSNGDINAGKGAKTSADVPAPIYVCDNDFYCTLDARGEVSGAGIATLQTIPGSPRGNVYLIAPRGTVDAGAAGIRVSGDLFVAALAVANANNIQVQGKSVGLPPQPVTNLTLTTASTAATEAAAIASNMHTRQPASIVDVEITGFGGDFDQPALCAPNSTRCK